MSGVESPTNKYFENIKLGESVVINSPFTHPITSLFRLVKISVYPPYKVTWT